MSWTCVGRRSRAACHPDRCYRPARNGSRQNTSRWHHLLRDVGQLATTEWIGCTVSREHRASGGGAPAVNADCKLPDPNKAGVAEKLFRLDCGRSVANHESVWTPGKNVGRQIEFSSTCWLIKHGDEWLLWDTGVPESAHSDPRGWSTIPTLIVYHLDKTLTDQFAEVGLRQTISRVLRYRIPMEIT